MRAGKKLSKGSTESYKVHRYTDERPA